MGYTLIIDGNYFLFRTLHVIGKTGSEILGTDKDREMYVRKLATDLAYQLRLTDGFVDNVVWTLDSRSWRKDFYPDADYKGTRKKSSDLNWDNFTKATGEFKNILASHGVVISQIDGAEGDDLIYAWNTECLANGKSTLIFTGDKDLLQLVAKNESNDAHSIMYSPVHKNLYVPPGYDKWIKKENTNNDIFEVLKSSVSISTRSKQLVDLMSTKGKSTVTEVDPVEVMFTKVLTGDSGDNVAPAYWYTKDSKSGQSRTYGVTERKALLVVEDFRKKHGALNSMYLHSPEHINDLAKILIRVVNAKYMSQDQIISNINTNINLMILNNKTIPDGILEAMFGHIESRISSMNTKMNEMTSMKKILANTEYLSANSMKLNSSIFKDDTDSDDGLNFITDRKQKGNLF